MPIICVVLTLAVEFMLLAIHLLLGLSGPFSAAVIPDLIVLALYAFVLGPVVFAGLRRLLRPALIEEPDRQSDGPAAVFGS